MAWQKCSGIGRSYLAPHTKCGLYTIDKRIVYRREEPSRRSLHVGFLNESHRRLVLLIHKTEGLPRSDHPEPSD